LRNNVADRRVMDDARDLATRESSTRGNDRLSDRKPIGLRIGSIHAIEGDQVALIVAHSHADIDIELPRPCNRSIHD
jgi:hypothetical protein